MSTHSYVGIFRKFENLYFFFVSVARNEFFLMLQCQQFVKFGQQDRKKVQFFFFGEFIENAWKVKQKCDQCFWKYEVPFLKSCSDTTCEVVHEIYHPYFTKTNDQQHGSSTSNVSKKLHYLPLIFLLFCNINIILIYK